MRFTRPRLGIAPPQLGEESEAMIKTRSELVWEALDAARGKTTWEAIAAFDGAPSTSTLENWKAGLGNPNRRLVVCAFRALDFSEEDAERKATEFWNLAQSGARPEGPKPFNQRKATTKQPPLSDPPSVQDRISHYALRAIDVLGRDDEIAFLDRFVGDTSPFLWMQLAGAGGQG